MLAALGVLAVPAGAADFRLLEIDGVLVKWGAPEAGTGAEVSYGFALRPVSFPDARNCGELAPIGALAAAWGGDPARRDRIAADAFAMWSRAADVRFRPVGAGERPDILIGAQAKPQHIAFANVWHDGAGARNGVAPLTRAIICFNPRQAWVMGEAPGAVDLRTALAHEIGHAIGLDHPGASGALMGYDVQGRLDALLPGDVAGAVALYGPPAH
jgi:hypothetical protein